MQRPVWAEMTEYLLAGADCLRKATKWSEVTNRGCLWSKYKGQVDQVPAVAHCGRSGCVCPHAAYCSRADLR